jgi:hypothetical protein
MKKIITLAFLFFVLFSYSQSLKTIYGLKQVCNGTKDVIYSFNSSGVTGATVSWSTSNGITGISTSNSIIVNFDTTNSSGVIGFTESIGNLVVGYGTLNITILQTPSLGTISGDTTVCANQTNNVNYSVLSRSDVSDYIWTVPSGATFTGILNEPNKINVKYGATAVSGNVSVMASCGSRLGTASTLAITVDPLPPPAGNITGTSSVCAGQTLTYSVPVIDNTSAYIWTLPSGSYNTSLMGNTTSTNSIRVDYSLQAISGNISVRGVNSCGVVGAASSLAIKIGAPLDTGTIIGTTIVCSGQNNIVYSVPLIDNSSSYKWTLPSGATGTSSTNSISVNYGANATNGNISVSGINSCGIGLPIILPIQINNCPPYIQYKSPKNLTIGNYVEINPTNSGGLIQTYSISPSLPTGLIFDVLTGIITGTPTVLSPATTFTIIAYNSVGISSAIILISTSCDTLAPTGLPAQNLLPGSNLSTIQVVGSNIKWYANQSDADKHINPLPNTTLVSNGNTYYATQTNGGCESITSLGVSITSIIGLIADIDGNVYNTIDICNQKWIKENLNVTKYSNGDVIPNVSSAYEWINTTSGAWICK